MERFAVAVVVEAADAEEAERFLANMLTDGIRWDRPLPVPYIGEACPIVVARRYRTAEIHLLRDGFRVVAVPERGA
jgi:hypothetical protein